MHICKAFHLLHIDADDVNDRGIGQGFIFNSMSYSNNLDILDQFV